MKMRQYSKIYETEMEERTIIQVGTTPKVWRLLNIDKSRETTDTWRVLLGHERKIHKNRHGFKKRGLL